MHAQPPPTPEREAFYQRMAPHSLTPLWEVLRTLIKREPQSPAVPHLWRYAEVRPFLMEAGRLITAHEAERRVLVLENPGLKGKSRITSSMYAGLQLIQPGEVAPAHRHSQSALRFVVEGKGAFTAVDGEKTVMEEGDFVITPSWTWHDHGNESDRPMVWMDGLDVPLVEVLDCQFAEPYPEEKQVTGRPSGDSLARYGQGLLPLGYEQKPLASPIFNYPYARTRAALAQMSRTAEWDQCHGLKMRYVNPATGDYAMPTIGAFMQMLPKDFRSIPYRATDGATFAVVEGKGRTIVTRPDGSLVTFDWGPRDIFVVPSWLSHRHEADSDSFLFSFSDRPAQQKLGLWRELRGNA
jgi:gentisate 1,2-dioxygenase